MNRSPVLVYSFVVNVAQLYVAPTMGLCMVSHWDALMKIQKLKLGIISTLALKLDGKCCPQVLKSMKRGSR